MARFNKASTIQSFAFVFATLINKTLGIRVSKREEVEGLDINEHGMDAYEDFRMNDH